MHYIIALFKYLMIFENFNFSTIYRENPTLMQKNIILLKFLIINMNISLYENKLY